MVFLMLQQPIPKCLVDATSKYKKYYLKVIATMSKRKQLISQTPSGNAASDRSSKGHRIITNKMCNVQIANDESTSFTCKTARERYDYIVARIVSHREKDASCIGLIKQSTAILKQLQTTCHPSGTPVHAKLQLYTTAHSPTRSRVCVCVSERVFHYRVNSFVTN